LLQNQTAAFRSIVETSAPSSFDVIIPLLDSTMAGIGIEWRDRLVKMSQVVRIFQARFILPLHRFDETALADFEE
jgi:hypothetical protein